MITNDTSRVVRMMPQLGASLKVIILTILEVSFMLLESSITILETIYSTGITHDDHHKATGWKSLPWANPLAYFET